MSKHKAKKTIECFADLKPNWDSYGATTIDQETINKALALLEYLPDWGWQAVPSCDGDIQIEISKDGFDIEILISKYNKTVLA